jgi:hypothetical protein
MKTFKLKILVLCTAVLLLMACKKEEDKREELPEGRVTFDLPATQEVVEYTVNVKEVALVSLEMKAVLSGAPSADTHYVTFAPDTAKIANYRLKYGATALLLPTQTYLYYKQKVIIPAGSNISESAVLNLSYQTTLRARSTYVLPLAITSVDGIPQDPVSRRVVYYVFKTGEPLYLDHTGFTVTAIGSSTLGGNVASRTVDAATGTTFWASSNTVPLPQYVTIDYARNVTFSGIDYFFPTAITKTMGGYTTSAKVETSTDNITWTDRGTFAINIDNTLKKQTITLPSLTTARYLRFSILEATPYNASATVVYNVGFVSGILLRN